MRASWRSTLVHANIINIHVATTTRTTTMARSITVSLNTFSARSLTARTLGRTALRTGSPLHWAPLQTTSATSISGATSPIILGKIWTRMPSSHITTPSMESLTSCLMGKWILCASRVKRWMTNLRRQTTMATMMLLMTMETGTRQTTAMVKCPNYVRWSTNHLLTVANTTSHSVRVTSALG